MRRAMILLLCALMAGALALPAAADLVWEPHGNSFYEHHREECSYLGRNFLANGSAGYVTLHAAPGGAMQVMNLPNRTQIYVGYTWEEKGMYWAVTELSTQDAAGTRTRHSGWVPLDDLAPVYDGISFEEDHGAEFAEYDGSGDGLTSVCLYTYPGGIYCGELKENRAYLPFAETFHNLYTDSEGRRWSYVGYYMGRHNAWACLDDPDSDELGIDAPLSVSEVRTGTSEGMVEPSSSVPAVIPDWVVPTCLAVLAVLITALTVRGRRRKQKHQA